MEELKGRQELYIPTYNGDNTFTDQFHFNNQSPNALYLRNACSAQRNGPSHTHIPSLAYEQSATTNAHLAALDRDLSTICSIFEPDVDVGNALHLAFASATDPSISSHDPFLSPRPQGASMQSVYHQNSNPMTCSPSPTTVAAVYSQAASTWLAPNGQPQATLQTGVVDPIAHRPTRPTVVTRFTSPNMHAGFQLSVEGYQQDLPPLSYSSAATPAYSSTEPQTPSDGLSNDGAKLHRSLSRSPSLQVAINNHSFNKDSLSAKPAASCLATPSGFVVGTPSCGIVQPRIDQPIAASGQSPIIRVDAGVRYVSDTPLPDTPSKKRKRDEDERNTSQSDASDAHTHIGNSSATPFTERKSRRRRIDPGLFPLLSETIGARGKCKFVIKDEDGTQRVCGHELVKDAKSILDHLNIHYTQLRYADMTGKVYCPWCRKTPTQSNNLSRHITYTELEINAERCPCGGTNSRGNQKNNTKRHQESKQHKAWEAEERKRKQKEDAERSSEDFVEGSSNGANGYVAPK